MYNITGRSDNISNACKLIATITKISTGMNVDTLRAILQANLRLFAPILKHYYYL